MAAAKKATPGGSRADAAKINSKRHQSTAPASFCGSFHDTILATLGNAPDVIEPGKIVRFSTNGKAGDLAGWCRLFDDRRGGVYGCHRQGISSVWSTVDHSVMTATERATLARQVAAAAAERQVELHKQWAENATRIARLWAECRPLSVGDPVTMYLKKRAFGGVWPLPACLRMHRAMPYWTGGEKVGAFPAMVAPLVATDGRMVALHRTYLHADGRKADVPTVKKLTGAAGPLAGACIPLFKPVNGVVAIAEGIETALAAWCASGLPTVAAYCASNLASWQWPSGVRRLVICADHDDAGRQVADRLQQRARLANLHVDVMTPTTAGTDWADVWAQRDAVTIEGGVV